MQAHELEKLTQLVKRERAAQLRVRRAQAEANARREELIEAAAELHASDVTLSALAEVLGLSSTRVHQLLAKR